VRMPTGTQPTGPAGSLSDSLTYSSRSSSSSSTAAFRQPPAGDKAARDIQVVTPSAHSQPSAFALSRGALLPQGANLTTNTTSTSNSSSMSDLLSSSSALSVPAHSGSLSVAVANHSKPAHKCWQAWQGAPEAVRQSLLGLHDNRLSRFYMWAQTECSVLLALYLPTGERGERGDAGVTCLPKPSVEPGLVTVTDS
jgi:hypothetical protein